MMRTLLEERFQLRWRLQPREIVGYAMRPAREDGRPGPRLRPFTGDCDARANNAPVRFDSADYEEKTRCNWTGMNASQRAVGVSMAAVANRLTLFMATPVSDRTGWTGLFNFEVIADTSDMPYASLPPFGRGLGARVPVDAPYLLQVFRDELGLDLVKERVTINDFIIERVQPLIGN